MSRTFIAIILLIAATGWLGKYMYMLYMGDNRIEYLQTSLLFAIYSFLLGDKNEEKS